MACAAIGLHTVLCGIVGLVITGIVIEATHVEAVQSYIFFIAGAICLIPGGMLYLCTFSVISIVLYHQRKLHNNTRLFTPSKTEREILLHGLATPERG